MRIVSWFIQRAQKRQQIGQGSWICSRCGTSNGANWVTCKTCGNRRPWG